MTTPIFNRKRKLIRYSLYVIIILSLLLVGCSREIYNVAYPTLSDGKYDSEFPYKNCSKQLKEIVETVEMVSTMAFYTGYVLPDTTRVKLNHIDEFNAYDYSDETFSFHRNSSGSATVIYNHANQIALLTCAHIIDFPDSIVTYRSEGGKTFVKTIAFKNNQIIYVNFPQTGIVLDVLAKDSKLDIAVLGQKLPYEYKGIIPYFDYPMGNAGELEWGAFVYLIGYPVGKKMITRGIVSAPDIDASGTFLIDALFNKGFSGGIVLAVRDGVPNFELVGIAKSVSASYEKVLIPEKDQPSEAYNPFIPYEGEAYVESIANINYGITHAITVEAIRDFFEENEDNFTQKGYNFSRFIQ